MRRWGVLVVVLLGAWCAAASPAQAEVRWLCTPAVADDPCDGPLTTTVQATGQVVEPAVPARPPVDCFYVYPTVSNQVGPNATQTPDPEVVSIAQLQAARFSERCRVFVPLYRQNTVAGIFAGGFTAESRAVAYADVKEAFESYLRTENAGRGFVLIGHSQGTGVLRKLIAETVDQQPKLRERLVAAYLLGGNVLVPEGRDRGGDFSDVPLCGADTETGCVVAWSTFDRTPAPPENTRFGRPPTGEDRLTGKPPVPGMEVACTNPASLASNARTEVHPILRGEPFAAGLIAAGTVQTFGGPPPTASTPYLVPPDRYTARCERVNGAHVLLVEGLDGARDLNPSPDDTWGLHLVDGNIALGDLVDLLGRQTDRFLRPDVRLTTRSRFDRRGRVCSARSVRVTVTGAVRRVRARAGRGARVDTRAPYRVRVKLRGGRVNRVRVAVLGTDGVTRVVTRRVRAC